MTGYAVRVIASDTRLARSLFSYLPRGVATLHTTRIINVRGMSIGYRGYLYGAEVFNGEHDVLGNVSFRSCTNDRFTFGDFES